MRAAFSYDDRELISRHEVAAAIRDRLASRKHCGSRDASLRDLHLTYWADEFSGGPDLLTPWYFGEIELVDPRYAGRDPIQGPRQMLRVSAYRYMTAPSARASAGQLLPTGNRLTTSSSGGARAGRVVRNHRVPHAIRTGRRADRRAGRGRVDVGWTGVWVVWLGLIDDVSLAFRLEIEAGTAVLMPPDQIRRMIHRCALVPRMCRG